MALIANVLKSTGKFGGSFVSHVRRGADKHCKLLTKRAYTSSVAHENQQRRVELATAYRAAEKCGLNEAIDNHITVMAPARSGSGKQVMLVVPEDIYWSQVTPSCLIGLGDDNEVVEGSGTPMEAAQCIHRGVRKYNNHPAICHLHSPYATALACLEDCELRMIHQTSPRYVDRIAYDTEYGGLGHGDEGGRIGKVLGNAEVMVMGNHGSIFVGPSVAVAFDRAYFFERCAMFQMLAMNTGKPLKDVTAEVIKNIRAEYDEKEDQWANRHLFAYTKVFAKDCEEFKNYDFCQ